MRKYNLFLILFCFCFWNANFAQKSHKNFRIENSSVIEGLSQSMSDDWERYSDLFSCLKGDTLFFCRADYYNPKQIELFKYDIKTATYCADKVNLEPLLCKNGSAYYLMNFAVSDKYLVFFASNDEWQFLFFFKRQNGNYVYDFKYKDTDNLFMQGLEFLPNGKLLGLKNYVYPIETADESTKLSVFNPETKSIEKVVKVDFPLPLYSLTTPYSILSVNDSSVFLSQRGDYKISEYDFDLNEISVLTGGSNSWKRMPQSLSDSIMNVSRQAVDRLYVFEKVKERYSCIHRIHSDGDKLFVVYSKKGNFHRYYYDVWRKENGEWKLAEKEIKDYSSSVRHFYKRSLFGFNDDHFYLIGDKALRLGLRPPDFGCHIKPVYMLKLKKYLMNNPIPYCVEVLSFD